MDTAVRRDGPHRPRMRVYRNGRAPKPRCVFVTAHAGPAHGLGIHNNSLKNLRRAILERVFFVEVDGELACPPRPLARLFEERLNGIRIRLLRSLGKTTPSTETEFLSTYTGRQRQVYEQAAQSLRTKGISPRDGWLKAFLKAEKVDFWAKADPAARIIQPRDPRYILETGRFLKQLEHPVYRAIAKAWGCRTRGANAEQVVMKGLTPHGVGGQLRLKWDKYVNPVAVGLDASRFDQHVSVDALRFEHSIYAHCFTGEDRKYLQRLLESQVHNRGVARASDGSIAYSIDGMRGSGDINTGMGNCLLMSTLVLAFCESVGIRASLANNGDDCVLFMEKSDLSKISSLGVWFREMGFTMKVEAPVSVFEQIEFCHMHPVWTPEGWLMVRNLAAAVAKDCTTILDMEHHAKRVWDAIGKCGVAVAGGVPILHSFYNALIRNGSASGIAVESDAWYKSSGAVMLARGMNRSHCTVDPRTRHSFWLAFGVLPDAQEAAEELYDGLVLYTGLRTEPTQVSTFPALF